jgi:hypothetical protein
MVGKVKWVVAVLVVVGAGFFFTESPASARFRGWRGRCGWRASCYYPAYYSRNCGYYSYPGRHGCYSYGYRYAGNYYPARGYCYP